MSLWLRGARAPTGSAVPKLVVLGLLAEPAQQYIEGVLQHVWAYPGQVPARIAVSLGLQPEQVHHALRNLRRRGLVLPPQATREVWPVPQ